MSTTTLVGTPDPDDPTDPTKDGKILDFRKPDPTTDEPGTALEPKVVDAEIVDPDAAGERVPVDPPIRAEDRSITARMRTALQAKRRPVIAPWLRSPEEFTATVRWGASYAGHTAAYHAVRSPLYAAMLAARSPRGLVRVLARTANWVRDAEAKPLRDVAIAREDGDMYLKLARQRAEDTRSRKLLVFLALVLLSMGVLVLVGWAPWWAQWLAALAGIGVLGWIGSPADKPVFGGRAVITSKPPRLTSDIVVRALGALGIAQINQALAKGGSGITFPAPITRDGPGFRADVDLPYGVTVGDILERRDKLASGLRRPLGCVWPEPAHDQHAGRLVLWVGDQDMAQARQPAWPLAKSGRADIFAALPFGHDQRGRLVSVLLMFANMLIGAMPRQGKTFAMRVLLLACALDPRVQLRVFELKGTGDLSAFEQVAHHYGSGADDDTVEQAVGSLRQLVHEEIPRRAKTIKNLPKHVCPENKVTPELAGRRALGLFPIVLGIDECQEMFAHPKYGAEAAELSTRLIKLGPALGLILVLATQRPDKDSLPTGVSANVGIRFCLRVMGQMENDMVLGTSSYKNGLRATTFTSKDRGIGYLVGAGDEPQIVRGDYLDSPAAERIAARARDLREKAGTITGHAAGETPYREQRPAITLLADIAEVIRAEEDKLWSETVVDRLAELRPEVYRTWAAQDGKAKATQLAAALKPYGVATGQVWAAGPDGTGANRRGIDREHILTALHTTRGNTE